MRRTDALKPHRFLLAKLGRIADCAEKMLKPGVANVTELQELLADEEVVEWRSKIRQLSIEPKA